MSGKRVAKKPKKKIKKRTLFTVFSMFNLFWYTVAVLVANFHDHMISSELTVAWFSAWTVELALLFGIKIKDKSSGMTLWGEKMQVLTDLTLDKLINLYVGIVTHDKKQLIEWDDHRRTPLYELKQRTLAQDTMILGALRCAKANGFTGEEG